MPITAPAALQVPSELALSELRRDLRDDCELDATTLPSLPTHPDMADKLLAA